MSGLELAAGLAQQEVSGRAGRADDAQRRTDLQSGNESGVTGFVLKENAAGEI